MKKNMFIICICVFVSLSAISHAEEIKIGYSNWPPMIFTEKGQKEPVGAIVDYYENDIAIKMELTLKWLGPFPVPRAIKMLQNNKLDMIPFLTKNPEREKKMAYPDNPFYIMKPVVCLKKEIGIDKLEKWDDLRGVVENIGIHYGTAFQKKLTEKYPYLKLRSIRHDDNTIEYALRLITEGRLDAFIHSDRIMTDKAIFDLNIENRIKSIDAPESERPLYVIFSLKRTDLLDKYNKLYGKMNTKE